MRDKKYKHKKNIYFFAQTSSIAEICSIFFVGYSVCCFFRFLSLFNSGRFARRFIYYSEGKISLFYE